MAYKRILKEIREMKDNSPVGCFAAPDKDDLFHWTATILGPEDSPYENGVFALDIHLPPDYPFKCPSVIFITRIYHPNISPRGQICMKILCCEWTPSITISKLLTSIRSLMKDPDVIDGSHVMYTNVDIARQFKGSRENFKKIAKGYTQRYAK